MTSLLPRATPGTLGYDRSLEWKERPSPDELALCGWSVVRAAERPAADWIPLAAIGEVHLYLARRGDERAARAVFSDPLIAAKRGHPAQGGYVGVDGQVRLSQPYPATAAAGPGAPLVWGGPATAPAVPRGARGATRVAVIDVSFDGLPLLHQFGAGRFDGPYPVGLAGGDTAAPLDGGDVLAGHGTAMAGIVLQQIADARLGLFRIPSVAGAVRAYVGATDVAVAVAQAVEGWRADVVVIGMSEGAWGTPRHLREILREAARSGRGGRGVAIFCSVGDPAKNHSRAEDSAALGADDLASQPWVLAVAPCDARGRWQRTELGYEERPDTPGAIYGRIGPSVALCARGDGCRYGTGIAADDSSQATALAGGAAARVLAAAPWLGLDELRAILTLTADVPAVIDGGRGVAAGIFDGWDRHGHSFKIGYGGVNGAAAALAAADPLALALFSTRPCPDPPLGVPSFARRLAESWEQLLWRQAMERLEGAGECGNRLAWRYARVRGVLAQASLHSLAAREALAWLARHLRAIAEEGERSSWFCAAQDHGALIDRIRYAAGVLRDCVPDRGTAALGSTEMGVWWEELDAALETLTGEDVAVQVATWLAEIVRPTTRPVSYTDRT